MLSDVPSDGAFALLRDLVARAEAGVMLDAAHVSSAAELMNASLATADDVEHGIKLRVTRDGIAYQAMIEAWGEDVRCS